MDFHPDGATDCGLSMAQSSRYPGGRSDKSKAKSARSRLTNTADEKEKKAMKQRRSQFNNTTRWLADSSFTTYFGKPAFHPYGRANVNPPNGGFMYGNSMLTHNVNAECGDHPPQYQQVYESAFKKGKEKTYGFRVPKIPYSKSHKELTAEQKAEQDNRKPIMPKENRPPTKKG